MSWGIELWDQFDNISAHTQKGIDFCERLLHFSKERCAIEAEYATKLKRMAKSYQPKVEKGDKKNKDEEFTCYKGFYGMLKEIHDLAGQHEVICENLTNNIIRDLQTVIQETKQERKRLLADASKQQLALQNQMSQLDRAKQKYVKAFRDAEKAQDLYKKAEMDDKLSRSEVEKQKQTMNTRIQTSDDCKAEYALEVQRTKDVQNNHYTTAMPQIFTLLQEMDEKRVTKVQSSITFSADVERQVMPIIMKCIDGMTASASSIDCSVDSRIVVDRYKTGFYPPNDIPFEDLSAQGGGQSFNGGSRVDGAVRSGSGTVSSKSAGKRPGIGGIFGQKKTEEPREDYGHLPPNQQRKQLNLKLEGLRGNLAKETSERDALVKMKDVYQQNTSLGNPATVEKQLEENGLKLDRLHQEIHKFETYLNDMERGGNGLGVQDSTPTPSPYPERHTMQQSSATVHTNASMSAGVTVRNVERTTAAGPADHNFQAQDSFEDEFGEHVGTCVALYTYEATSDTALSMVAGEQFDIIERDQGDGWTHVRRTNGETGFIPTSYIEIND